MSINNERRATVMVDPTPEADTDNPTSGEAVLARREAAPAAPTVLTVEQAQLLTEEIRCRADALWDRVMYAYVHRAWAVLGYQSWDAYCDAEFAATRVRLPRESRREVVQSLRDNGLSVRAISAATGASTQTVQNDLRAAGVVNHHTDRRCSVLGVDGKRHPAKRPPGTVSGRFYRELRTLQSAAIELHKVAQEQAFVDNADAMRADHAIGVKWAQELLAKVADQFDTGVHHAVKIETEVFADLDDAAKAVAEVTQ